MTFIGKIFSVIILLLSLGFMVAALMVNASHRNWRDLIMSTGGYRDQIQTFTQKNTQLEQDKERILAEYSREIVARRTALAALQTQLDQLEGELETRLGTIIQLEARNTELTQLDKSRAELLKDLTDDNKVLREQIRTEQADRDKLFTQTLVLTDQMNELRGVRQELEIRNTALIKQITRFKEVVDAKGINIADPLVDAPPKRNGNILVVNRPRLLVEVSIGHDDGIRSGHLLEVTRSGRYVAKVRVRNVEPNRAVAEILRDYSQGIIQEGDRVDTTLE